MLSLKLQRDRSVVLEHHISMQFLQRSPDTVIGTAISGNDSLVLMVNGQ